MADNELPATEHDDRGAGPATKSDPVIQQSSGTPIEKGQDPATEGTPPPALPRATLPTPAPAQA
ncbi:hypothetical protein JKI95_08825 [Corynebacterium aquatimens]|uniref:hypothetical protein n=1 Tax=Corynebacterium aquatimens TaxID=1190508 RepID=UPI003313AE16|nr:hypothetical protein JKI95_08825 [Corynebacterium aquatimens]